MIETLVARAHEAGAKVGLCGQAPSNNPAFAKLLVKAGIDTISVTPDSFVAVKKTWRRRKKPTIDSPAPSGEIETALPSV
jgi:phosphoenolpyruvate synthase/pyruvate phosphate dikinase